MNRRTVLKQFCLVAAGATLIPACVTKEKPADTISTSRLPIDESQSETLTALSEAILPKTDTPGASEIGAPAFVLTMAGDCLSKDDRARFLRGFADFEQSVKKEKGKSFAACDAAAKTSIVGTLDSSMAHNDLIFFYRVVKRFTTEAYTEGQYFLSHVQVYKLIPGKFQGCVTAS